MKQYKVIKDRKTPFKKPLILKKYDTVILGNKYTDNPNWPGWICCKTENNAGWIPKQIVKRNGNKGIIIDDYDATEFNIKIGEIIVMEKCLNGWIWGYKKNNPHKKAWAPLDFLEEV